MKHFKYFFTLLIFIGVIALMAQTKENKLNKLTVEEEHVILNKGTERPFTGEYDMHFEKGTYLCKQCNAPLYQSEDKFDSQCGWPSFDDELPGAVKRIPDADGRRTEIVCANCGGHLGHVFIGEKLTDKNTRHCVNSISINFEPLISENKTERAIFASGCFWGTEYHLSKVDGVISTAVGYTGGTKDDPTYKIGTQYRSVIFYLNDDQKEIAEKLITKLENKGLNVATEVAEATTFWKAEDYHQDYYDHKGTTPYCHIFTKRF
jgi:peptide methionine sulfoxide reductase msrA/msrB